MFKHEILLTKISIKLLESTSNYDHKVVNVEAGQMVPNDGA